jgi:hypothetical protein
MKYVANQELVFTISVKINSVLHASFKHVACLFICIECYTPSSHAVSLIKMFVVIGLLQKLTLSNEKYRARNIAVSRKHKLT